MTKLPLKSLQKLIEKVKEITAAEILVANTIEKLIENLQSKKKTKLNLGKSITEEDWLLLEKKLKQDLSNFKRPDLTIDEILDRLATQGLEEKVATLLPSKDQLKREKQKREKAEAETNHWHEAYNQLRQRIDELNLPVSQLDDSEAIEIEATEIKENSEELLSIAKNRSDSTNGGEPVGVSQSTPCVNEASVLDSRTNSIDLSNPETQKLLALTLNIRLKMVLILRISLFLSKS